MKRDFSLRVTKQVPEEAWEGRSGFEMILMSPGETKEKHYE